MDIIQCLEGNHQQNHQFTSGINCFIRLAAFVKEKASESVKLLKSIEIKKACMLTIKYATQHRAQNSVETFAI
jgi:hypothetical protein